MKENCNATQNNRPSKVLKIFQSTCLALAFLALGLYIAMFGPTLPTLSHNLQVQIDTMSYILPGRAAGYLSGSIISGLIYDKVDHHLMMFCSLSVSAIGILLIPYMNHVVAVAVIMCFVSLSTGFLDTAGNVMCLQIWGNKSGPFLQALHFFFALGTTIAPLLAIPFIMDVEHKNKSDQVLNATNKNETAIMSVNDSLRTDALEKFHPVVYAYFICAVFTGLIALSFLYLGCCHRRSAISSQKNTVKQEGKKFRIKILILLFIFYMIYVGTEETFGVFIYTFAVRCQKQYSKAQASLVNSLFWGAFAVGRFLAIPIARYFSPSKVLATDLLGTVTSAITLALFSVYAERAEALFWLAVAVYGISMASIFPTGISWAEQYITVTGKAAMVLVVGSATGSMVFPIFIGQFVEENPMALMYFLVTSLSTGILIFSMSVLVARTKGKRLKSTVGVKDMDEKEDIFPIE